MCVCVAHDLCVCVRVLLSLYMQTHELKKKEKPIVESGCIYNVVFWNSTESGFDLSEECLGKGIKFFFSYKVSRFCPSLPVP